MPRDAESWLAERGIKREPLEVDPVGQPPMSAREAQRLMIQSQGDRRSIDEEEGQATAAAAAPPGEDDLAEAVAFIRRSTAVGPQSEGRVRGKLVGRGWAHAVVEGALERARREGLVDDAAMVRALIDERLARGHAPARVRRDLTARGFTEDMVRATLAVIEEQDPEARAFDVAAKKAAGLTGVPAETAYRRVVAFVARRGYPEALARKVARDAVFASRDGQRAAER